MIDNKLIESALGLTSKTIEDFGKWNDKASNSFFVLDTPKFCYYLLSPEFIEKYYKQVDKIETGEFGYMILFGHAIYHLQYQSGNEQPLIDLLSKIK